MTGVAGRPSTCARARALPPALALVVAVLVAAALLLPSTVTAQSGNHPPLAVITSPRMDQQFMVGQVIVFDGRASYDDDLPNLTYRWNYTDSIVEGKDKAVVERAFLVPGNYVVVLTCIDSGNRTNSAYVRISIRAENRPPVAAITTPADGARSLVERSIGFDGSTSRDPEGGSLRFIWTTNRTTDPIGDRDRFSIKLPIGRYRVTLWVYDLAGANSTATVNISVITDSPPSLGGASVTPTVGPVSTPGGFVFRVTYSDPDDDPPQEILVKVAHRSFFNAYAMLPDDPADTDHRDGKGYHASVPLETGAHQFVFSCRDPFFFCATALFDGPQVFKVDTVDIAAVGVRVVVNWTELGTVSVLRASPPAPPPTGAVVLSSVVRLDLEIGSWSSARVSMRYDVSTVIDPESVGLWRFDAGRGLWVPASGQGVYQNESRVEGELPGGGVFAVFGAVSRENVNHPPLLQIAYDAKDAYVDRTLGFDASKSSDPDGGVLLFYWSFGDGPGGAGAEWSPGVRVGHVFKGAGVFVVVLRALDGENEEYLYRNVSIRKYEVEPPGPLDNPQVLFVMGLLLLMAFVVAIANRIRLSRPKGYEAQFGGAYERGEEGEYAKLFRKLTEDELRGAMEEPRDGGGGAEGAEGPEGAGDGDDS